MRFAVGLLLIAFLGMAYGRPQFFQNLVERYINPYSGQIMERMGQADPRELSKLAEKLDELIGKPKPSKPEVVYVEKPVEKPVIVEKPSEVIQPPPASPVVIEKPVYIPVYMPQPQQPMHYQSPKHHYGKAPC